MALREEFNAEPAAQRHAVHHGGSRPGSRGHALWDVDEILTLGASDGGSRELLDVLNTERIVTTAGLAADYARERKIFNGMPIGSYQGIQFPLADAKVKMAKYLAGHTAGLTTDRAIQTLGGMEYSKEYHVERLWRDARLFRVAPVSEEMILNYVAQHDIGLQRSY